MSLQTDEQLNLKIYPSGFIGNGALRQSSPADPADVARQLMDRNRAVEIQRHTYSLQAEDYMSAFVNGAPHKDKFEYREEVIRFAKEALFANVGTNMTTMDWLNMQYSCPEFSEYHHRWIVETLRFLQGRPRLYSVSTWSSLVSVKSQLVYSGKGVHPDVIRAVYDTYGIESMSDLVLHWLQLDGGFYDLVQSLFVLYGPRRA